MSTSKSKQAVTITGAAATAFLVAAVSFLSQTVVRMYDQQADDMRLRIAALEASHCKP